MPPTFLLLLLLSLLHVTNAVSSAARRVQTTFNLVLTAPTSANASPSCPSRISHRLIQTYLGLNLDNASQPLDGIRWSDLSINSISCLNTQRPEATTVFHPWSPSPPTTSAESANPWFLTGIDNSPRRCGAFRPPYPAQFFFTDNFPRFRARFTADGLIPSAGALPASIANPIRGDIYMFTREFSSPTVFAPIVCIYLAVPTPTPAPARPSPSPEGAVCFPPTARVHRMPGDQSVPMQHLRIGDVVRVSSDGAVAPIVSFSHRSPRVWSQFKRLVLLTHGTRGRNETILTVTSGHLLRNARYKLVPAGQLGIGDTVLAANGRTATLQAVHDVFERGLYSPVTSHGDIVVDGIVASCYTTSVQAPTAHALLVPIRALFATLVGFGYPAVEWVSVVDILRLAFFGRAS